VEQRAAKSSWWFVTAWLGAFVVYLIASSAGGPRQADIINNIAWTLGPVFASAACWLTARAPQLTQTQQRAWKTMAFACLSWLIGQVFWAYYSFALGAEPPFSSNVFYLIYAALMVLALRGLSDSVAPQRFTMQHLGNLGLIGCCLSVALVIAFLEPVAQVSGSRMPIIGSLIHSSLVASTFFAALYYLWTQRWHATWIPMLLIVLAMGVYTAGNFIYVHALLVGTYSPADRVNATWLLMFVLIAIAAHLRGSTSDSAAGVDRRSVRARELMARRSRLLEATIPALLIVLMMAVGALAANQLTARVLVVIAVLLLIFAMILGAREAWVQGESQRLTLELRDANERLQSTNLELRDSEARVRDLNVHLEERVAQRTRQLQVACEELEGFAYAVAHDLKAPLRAIDGFAHLLDESLQASADERTTGYLARIRRSAVRMAALIDDLLAYSRIERRALIEQPVELQPIVQQLIGEHQREIEARGVVLTLDVAPITLRTDVEGLSLVLRNLLQNALKFTSTVQPARIAIKAFVSGQKLQITVSDNGIGFDMKYEEQIFKLFHRLHRDDQYPGTGIGLALVRKALERMGGSVSARGGEGEGATFIVRLNLESA
jgi:signal transduction histidine kinase